MFGGHKRYRGPSVFDVDQNPAPPELKLQLELVANSFTSNGTRNLNIMNTDDGQLLYGWLTGYVSNNFCWMQPSRTYDRSAPTEYHRYLVAINTVAKKGQSSHIPISSARLGMDCIARYDDDGNWYRALIIGVHGQDPQVLENTCKVIFIDYGNTQLVTYDTIAEPLKGHFEAPMQAVLCRIYNITPKLPRNRNAIDLELERFYVEYSERALEIKVRNRRPDYIVDVDLFVSKLGRKSESRFFRKHIGQDLVDSNLAYFADPEAAHAVSLPKGEPISTQSTISDEDCVNIEDSEDDEHAEYKRRMKLKNKVCRNLNRQEKKNDRDKVSVDSMDEHVKVENNPFFKFKPKAAKLENEPNDDFKKEQTKGSKKRTLSHEPEFVPFSLKDVQIDRDKFRPFG